jgi:hypothetical protein
MQRRLKEITQDSTPYQTSTIRENKQSKDKQ